MDIVVRGLGSSTETAARATALTSGSSEDGSLKSPNPGG
jgi:hypothetical protein